MSRQQITLESERANWETQFLEGIFLCIFNTQFSLVSRVFCYISRISIRVESGKPSRLSPYIQIETVLNFSTRPPLPRFSCQLALTNWESVSPHRPNVSHGWLHSEQRHRGAAVPGVVHRWLSPETISPIQRLWGQLWECLEQSNWVLLSLLNSEFENMESCALCVWVFVFCLLCFSAAFFWETERSPMSWFTPPKPATVRTRTRPQPGA